MDVERMDTFQNAPRGEGLWREHEKALPPPVLLLTIRLYGGVVPVRSLGNALDLHEVPDIVAGVGLLDEGGVADGVTDVIEGDLAGHAGVGHAGQRGQNVGRIGGAGGLQGLQSHIVGVIAHDGHSSDHVVAAVVGQVGGVAVDPVLKAVLEVHIAALSIEGGDIDGDVLALGGGQNHVGVPGVAGQQT